MSTEKPLTTRSVANRTYRVTGTEGCFSILISAENAFEGDIAVNLSQRLRAAAHFFLIAYG